ncbi:outer membrane protein assembly factor BamA, partial [candidate division CSSED10-310 bacterium]
RMTRITRIFADSEKTFDRLFSIVVNSVFRIYSCSKGELMVHSGRSNNEKQRKNPRKSASSASSAVYYFILLLILVSGLTASASEEVIPAPVSPAPQLTVSDIKIEFLAPEQPEAFWFTMARNLIFFKKGDQFSAERLEETLKALQLCKKFSEIKVDSHEDEDQIDLLFRLRRLSLIKDIKIEGRFPLFEREILNVMTIYPGDVYFADKLSEQESLIADIYKREGFIDPQVRVSAEIDPDDGFYKVAVKIDKGKYYSVKQFVIEGNRALSTAKLKLKMKTWRSSIMSGLAGRFIESQFNKDIDNLKKFYWKKKFTDATIQSHIDKNSEKKEVAIKITITEGSKYKIHFENNEEFSKYSLKKDVVIFKQGNMHDSGLRKSKRNIIERHHQAGYLNTTVKTVADTVVRDEKSPLRDVRFFITEGPQTCVRTITITGNTVFDEQRIQNQMLTTLPGFLKKGVYVPEVFTEDLNAIRTLYLQAGYMSQAFTKKEVTFSQNKEEVDLEIEISEGPQTLVSDLSIQGLTVLPLISALELIKLKQGEPFREYLILSDKNTLAAVISEKGYPHVTVKSNTLFNEDNTRVAVEYTIVEGPAITLGNIYYSGNFRTKIKTIQNELLMEPGKPFSLIKMLEGQRNLRNMAVFNSIKFKAIGLKEKAEEVSLFVEIEEKKPYFFQFGGGYETDKGFYVLGKTGDHNLLGRNKDAWIGGEYSQIGYRFEVNLTEPRLFGTTIASSTGVYVENEDLDNVPYEVLTYGASLGFSRAWQQKFSTSLTFRFERTQRFENEEYAGESEDSDDDLSDFDELAPRSVLVTTPALSYDSRDFFIRPRKGIFTIFSVDISKGLQNSFDDFVKYQYDLRYYITPFEKLTVAWKGWLGFLDSYSPTGILPKEERFRLGGTSTVRGFDAQGIFWVYDKNEEIGGLAALLTNLEFRYDLGMNFELAVFYDGGSTTETFDEVKKATWRDSAGLGIRYITPIGPIGFLYGFKLDPKSSESPGRLHFALGYTF